MKLTNQTFDYTETNIEINTWGTLSQSDIKRLMSHSSCEEYGENTYTVQLAFDHLHFNVEEQTWSIETIDEVSSFRPSIQEIISENESIMADNVSWFEDIVLSEAQKQTKRRRELRNKTERMNQENKLW